MTAPELTEAMITAAMAKVDARACTGSDRCYVLPSDVESARTRCTPKGRCVWLEVSTGLVKLIAQTNA